jgi:hypothetical protein
MQRYRSYGSRDESPAVFNERGWRGVNMRLHPSLLPPGLAASAINTRFRNGVPGPRGGAQKLPFINRLDSGTPDAILPYTTIYGQGEFNDPDDVRWHLLAADGGVFHRRDNNAAQSINLPPEVSIQYPVNFVQAFGYVVMFRGERLMPLVCSDVDTGFTNITANLTNYRYRATYADNDEVVFPPQPGFAYDDTLTYGSGDLVLFANKHYLANADTSVGEDPSDTPGKWDLVTWSSASTYIIGKTVVFEATRFVSVLAAAAGESPLTNPEKWDVVTHKVYAANQATSAGDLPTGVKFDYIRDIIPYADNGLFVQNRLWVWSDNLLSASDTLDLAVYLPATASFYINQGSSDTIVAATKFNDFTIVVFKSRSVHILENVYGDLTSISQTEITHSYGLVGPKAFCAVGKDLWFLSQRGVCSLTQTEQNKIQGIELPVSDTIQPLIDRINWQYASGATAAYNGNRFYLAVPIDDATVEVAQTPDIEDTVVFYTGLTLGRNYSWVPNDSDYLLQDSTLGGMSLSEAGTFVPVSSTAQVSGVDGANYVGVLGTQWRGVNNAILVFDFLNGEWAGHDEGDALCPVELFTFEYAGQERLFFTGADGFCSIYEQGHLDDVEDTSQDEETAWLRAQEIETTLVTRSYGPEDLVRWNEAQFHLATWNPQFTISAIFPGGFETKTLYDAMTRSRTRYIKPFNRAAYDVTNVNDDHGEPYREDYSVDPTAGVYFDGNGLNLDQFQDYIFRKKLSQADEAIQFRIVNTQGQLQILSLQVAGTAGARREGTFV